MFILPLPTSPGEHGADDHSAGMIGKVRRLLRFQVHKSANGFIAAALLIQLFSIAGVMPVQVWTAEPGYAVTVCFGLFALSACILFSLRNLLTEASQQRDDEQSGHEPQTVSVPTQNLHTAADSPALSALIVQDTRMIQAIIEKSLEKVGIRPLCVDNESAARQALDEHAFDLVIADAASMTSGRKSDLREILRAKNIPLLALVEAKRDAAELDADSIVTMPIVPHDLVQRAAELIAQPRVQRPASLEQPTLVRRELPELESEPLDPRALGDLESLGGRDFVRDIVAQFVADAASVLASLSAAIASRDQKAFREQAHALRSCAANVGAQNVYRMCLAWRDLDAREIAASGSQYMTMLEEEFERVRGALMLQQDSGGAGPDSKAA